MPDLASGESPTPTERPVEQVAITFFDLLVLRWSEAEAERRKIGIGAARAACWGTIKAKYKLACYEDLPVAKYADCVSFVKQAYASITGSDLDLPEQQTLDLE